MSHRSPPNGNSRDPLSSPPLYDLDAPCKRLQPTHWWPSVLRMSLTGPESVTPKPAILLLTNCYNFVLTFSGRTESHSRWHRSDQYDQNRDRGNRVELEIGSHHMNHKQAFRQLSMGLGRRVALGLVGTSRTKHCSEAGAKAGTPKHRELLEESQVSVASHT